MQAPGWLSQIVAVVRSLSAKKDRACHPAEVSQARAGRHANLRKTAMCSIPHGVPSAQYRRYKRL